MATAVPSSAACSSSHAAHPREQRGQATRRRGARRPGRSSRPARVVRAAISRQRSARPSAPKSHSRQRRHHERLSPGQRAVSSARARRRRRAPRPRAAAAQRRRAAAAAPGLVQRLVGPEGGGAHRGRGARGARAAAAASGGDGAHLGDRATDLLWDDASRRCGPAKGRCPGSRDRLVPVTVARPRRSLTGFPAPSRLERRSIPAASRPCRP